MQKGLNSIEDVSCTPKKEENEGENKARELTSEERGKLIVDHLFICRIVAAQLAAQYPTIHLDREELAAAGSVGLVQAGLTFRPDGGASFSHYAGVWVTRFETSRLAKTFLIRLSKKDREIAVAKPKGVFDPSLAWYELGDDEAMQIVDPESLTPESSVLEREKEFARKRVISVIKKLALELPGEECRVLCCYFECLERDPRTCWHDVAVKLSIPDRQVYRLRDRAASKILARLRHFCPAELELMGFAPEGSRTEGGDKELERILLGEPGCLASAEEEKSEDAQGGERGPEGASGAQ